MTLIIVTEEAFYAWLCVLTLTSVPVASRIVSTSENIHQSMIMVPNML